MKPELPTPEHGQELGTPVSEERVKECFEKDLDTAISECELLYEEGSLEISRSPKRSWLI